MPTRRRSARALAADRRATVGGIDWDPVTDPEDEASRPTRARPRRARRFVLPDVHHDERTAAGIVAFLDGPEAAGPRRGAVPPGANRPRPPKELDTRPDWTVALLDEASRHARYGRPASVLLLEIGCRPDGPPLDRVAHGLADLIRAEARETDRAVRMGPSSFRLLMPETNARAARHVGARLERAFVRAHAGRPNQPDLRIEVAAPSRGGDLEAALTEAERRLAD